MEPRFHAGDLALVRSQSSYRVGEVVAYESGAPHRRAAPDHRARPATATSSRATTTTSSTSNTRREPADRRDVAARGGRRRRPPVDPLAGARRGAHRARGRCCSPDACSPVAGGAGAGSGGRRRRRASARRPVPAPPEPADRRARRGPGGVVPVRAAGAARVHPPRRPPRPSEVAYKQSGALLLREPTPGPTYPRTGPAPATRCSPASSTCAPLRLSLRHRREAVAHRHGLLSAKVASTSGWHTTLALGGPQRFHGNHGPSTATST